MQNCKNLPALFPLPFLFPQLYVSGFLAASYLFSCCFQLFLLVFLGFQGFAALEITLNSPEENAHTSKKSLQEKTFKQKSPGTLKCM